MQQDNVAAFVYYIFYCVVRVFIFLVYISEEGCLYGKFGSRHGGRGAGEATLRTCGFRLVQ